MAARTNNFRRQLALATQFRELRRDVQFGKAKLPIKPGQEHRDAIAEKLGCKLTGRTLENVAKLLDLPEPIQRAIPTRVSKCLAYQILERTKDVQMEIANDLQVGLSRESIVRKYQLLGSGPHKNLQAVFNELLRLLSTLVSNSSVGITDLAVVDVRGMDVTGVLDEGIDLLRRVSSHRNGAGRRG